MSEFESNDIADDEVNNTDIDYSDDISTDIDGELTNEPIDETNTDDYLAPLEEDLDTDDSLFSSGTYNEVESIEVDSDEKIDAFNELKEDIEDEYGEEDGAVEAYNDVYNEIESSDMSNEDKIEALNGLKEDIENEYGEEDGAVEVYNDVYNEIESSEMSNEEKIEALNGLKEDIENEYREDDGETEVNSDIESLDTKDDEATNIVSDSNHEINSETEHDSANSNNTIGDINETSESIYFTQGNNDYGYDGTCGPTSVANSVNSVIEGASLSENDVVQTAVENDLCSIECSPAQCGGTTTDQLMEIYEQYSDMGIEAKAYDYDEALTPSQIADEIDNGSVVNIGTDSSILWDQAGGIFNSGLFGGVTDKPSDHWITVNGVDRQNGEIVGFNIIDSGGGSNYVNVDKFNEIYYGTDRRRVADPTSIVVSNKNRN